MKRTAAWVFFLASASLFAGRFVSPAASMPEPRAVTAEAPDQTPPALADVNREVDRLRDRLLSVPDSPIPTRDPFSFGRAPEAPRARGLVERPTVLAEPPAPALPKLVAILSSAADSNDGARTAVVALGDDVQFKKTGDEIGAFVVEAVRADALVLVDRSSSARYGVPLH